MTARGVAGERADEPHTLGRWLTDRAAIAPHRTAIDDRGVRIDYADLDARARALGEALRAAGYGPGSHLATVSGLSLIHI